MAEFKPKSFWQKPEGITGAIFLGGLVLGLGYLATLIPLGFFLSSTLSMAGTLMALAAVIYIALDSKARGLIGYMYKSAMRTITGLFVQIDPIGILKSYVDDMKNNLRKMNKQIGKLRGQMHKLQELIHNNKKQIQSSINTASRAKEMNKKAEMILKTRKAGRLRESNMKLEDLYKRMEVLYRVLTKMYENSEILLEDVKDQVMIKEQERKAIHASHSAMKSAMSVIKGDKDKRAMFDMALEKVADDVSQKVGEMEQFMDMSSNFMESIDLQNGVFEEDGMKMLEEWERKGDSLILGDEKDDILVAASREDNVLDLNAPIKSPARAGNHRNQYDSFFE